MEKFIAQQDEKCGECGCDIPRGEWCTNDGWDNIRCLDCQENEDRGENYG